MSCQVINCCQEDYLAFRSTEATDAQGSDGQDGEDVGFTNPNCPTGYFFNETACERES